MDSAGATPPTASGRPEAEAQSERRWFVAGLFLARALRNPWSWPDLVIGWTQVWRGGNSILYRVRR